jgi:hypothetical protein
LSLSECVFTDVCPLCGILGTKGQGTKYKRVNTGEADPYV